MDKAESFSINEYEKKKKWEQKKLKIEKFIKFITNIPYKTKQEVGVFIEEYDFKSKFLEFLNYLFTGLMVYLAVNNSNTILSYTIIILLVEHYVPWIVETIKKKYN